MTPESNSSWPEPDWKPIQPFPFSGARGAFTGLTAEEGRIELSYFQRPNDKSLVAIADFGPRTQGAPGLVHGGMILTVLDEALGRRGGRGVPPCPDR